MIVSWMVKLRMDKVYLLYLRHPNSINGSILIEVFKDRSVAEGYIKSKALDIKNYLVIEEREVRLDI